MTAPADRLQTLRDLGLSEYGARAYLALLELGTTEARDVSRLAKVPIAKIYSTLEQLQERGLVLVAPGPPKKFTPEPIGSFLRRQRDRHLAEARGMEEAEARLGVMFPIKGGAEVGDRGGFITLRGRESVVEKLSTLARDAEEEILLLANDGFATQPDVPIMLEKTAARGVRVRALVTSSPQHAAHLREVVAHAELRGREGIDGAPGDVMIAVFDHARVAIVHFVPDDASRYSGKDVAIVADEVAIVRMMQATLATLWSSAKPVPLARATGR